MMHLLSYFLTIHKNTIKSSAFIANSKPYSPLAHSFAVDHIENRHLDIIINIFKFKLYDLIIKKAPVSDILISLAQNDVDENVFHTLSEILTALD